ncbi:MAG: tetratricopeptide repeat protein [Phycisphaerae bacterium]|nr:tetratricopeptide repeat protein [Saprospiraceae bacterium]
MKFSGLILCLFSILCWTSAFSQSTHTPLLKGDRAYDQELYKAAEKQYRIAADHEIGNAQAVYNLGNSLYQQGNFEDAEKRFHQGAENVRTSAHRADALHNLGDACLKQRKHKEAVRAYEESLRHRPADPGTKMNLQMAKKRLREEEKKEKEQQQKQQQEQNQDQNQTSNQDPKNQQDKQQNQPNQPQQNQQGQPQKPQGEQQKKMEEQRLKKEDAKRLLETAIGPDDRKNAQKYRAAQQQTKPKGSKKDW